jgi:hypothetical protein
MQNIIILGMSERTVNAFCLAFKQYNNLYTIKNTPDEKAVYIIDIDTYAGGYAQFVMDVDTDAFLAVGLQNNLEIPDSQFLQKPIQLAKLFEKLDALVAQNKTDAETATPNTPLHVALPTETIKKQAIPAPVSDKTEKELPLVIPTVQPDARPVIPKSVATHIPNPIPIFSMSEGLLGHLLSIIQDRSNTTIMFNDADYWAIDITADKVYMSLAVDTVELGIEKGSNCRLRQFRVSDIETETIKPLSAVLWDLAFLVSNGRIPNTLTPTSLLSLYKWPNLTRLTVHKNTLRVCAFMSRTPCNMLILTKMLNLDYREVFGLLSSLSAVGLLRVVNKEVAQSIRESAKNSLPENTVNVQKRSFLSKLLAKITGV